MQKTHEVSSGVPIRIRLKNKFRQEKNRSDIKTDTVSQQLNLSTQALVQEHSEIESNKRKYFETKKTIAKKEPILLKDFDAAAFLASLSNVKLSCLDKPSENKQSTLGNLEDSVKTKKEVFPTTVTSQHDETLPKVSHYVHVQPKSVAIETTKLKTPLFIFPQKLMKMLDNDEINDVISWFPCGRIFVIKNQIKFTKDIMPRYLDGVKYTSFIRKLHRWGFKRHGIKEGAYYHPNFQKGNFTLCAKMCMVKKPKKYCNGAQLTRDIKSEIPFSMQIASPSQQQNHKQLQEPQLLSQISAENSTFEQKNLFCQAPKNISQNDRFKGTENYNEISCMHSSSPLREKHIINKRKDSLRLKSNILSSYPDSIVKDAIEIIRRHEAIEVLRRQEEKLEIKLCQFQELQKAAMVDMKLFLGNEQHNIPDCGIQPLLTIRNRLQRFTDHSLDTNLPFFAQEIPDTTYSERSVRRSPAA